MAIVGNNPATPDVDYTRGLDSVANGLRITMPEAANGAASIWWYGTTATGVALEAAIYADGADPALVVEAPSAYTAVGADQWHEVPLNTTVLGNGDTVVIVIIDPTNSGCGVAFFNGGGNSDSWEDQYSDLYSGGSWNDPGTDAWRPGSASRDLTMYLEYTPDAGAALSNIVGNGGLVGNGSLIVGPGGLIG